jgi:hypothetical protein
VYLATGEVTGFEGSRPIISKYDPPRSLGNWYPRVSHINGMMVTPESGIGSAKKLKDAIDANLGPEGVALEVDVLYTYSANRGFLKDLLECIQGRCRCATRPPRRRRRSCSMRCATSTA